MAGSRPGVILYFDIRPAIQRLTMEQRGELLTAILDYAEYGNVPDSLDDMVGLCFDLLRSKIERDADRYEESRAKKLYAVYCRECRKSGVAPMSFEEWVVSSDNRSLSDDIERYPTITETVSAPASVSATKSVAGDNQRAAKPPRSRFVPPTVEEVQAYCRERKNGVDAERFVDFYTAKGWKVGKEPMKDWKAAVRTWERRASQGEFDVSAVQPPTRKWNLQVDSGED